VHKEDLFHDVFFGEKRKKTASCGKMATLENKIFY